MKPYILIFTDKKATGFVQSQNPPPFHLREQRVKSVLKRVCYSLLSKAYQISIFCNFFFNSIKIWYTSLPVWASCVSRCVHFSVHPSKEQIFFLFSCPLLIFSRNSCIERIAIMDINFRNCSVPSQWLLNSCFTIFLPDAPLPDHIQQQQMHRIECIAEISEPSFVISLFSIIEPYGNKSQ